jgi:hypothetical protein
MTADPRAGASATAHAASVDRRALAMAIVLAGGLVCLRSIVPMTFGFLFDSDQAIVGLMAKHLSEFRTFPLFFYGQNYMLGVQAWMAAPFLWIGGPTIQMLRLPLIIAGVAVAWGYLTAIARRGVHPWLAFAAILPLVATTPAMSLELMTALGACIEPFLWVLLIWHWRDRPMLCGAMLCAGSLHREFTIFALPALAVASWRSWRSWFGTGLLHGAAAGAAVWIVVDVLKRVTNTLGPAGGEIRTGSLALQAATIAKWLSFEWRPYAARLTDVLLKGIPELLGLGPHQASRYGVPGTTVEGSVWGAAALAAACVVAASRLGWLRARRGPGVAGGRFFVYLGVIGVCTVLAYGLNGGLAPGAPVVLRYLLFALLIPVAIVGAFFLRERTRTLRGAVALLMVLWAAANVRDNLGLWRDYATEPLADRRRTMADYLVSHGIRYGRAGYWDAYAITFLTRERVILASTGVVRVSAYQSLVGDHAVEAVTLVRQPCRVGVPVEAWCVIGPGGQDGHPPAR